MVLALGLEWSNGFEANDLKGMWSILQQPIFVIAKLRNSNIPSTKSFPTTFSNLFNAALV